MKKFRKILALVLAFTMIMGLAMTASAATIVSNYPGCVCDDDVLYQWNGQLQCNHSTG